MERALAAPDRPTERFAPINILNISGGVHGSQIQQGVHSSSQTQSVDWKALAALILELRREIGSLSGDDAAIARAHIETLEAQNRSPAPSPGIVRESLSSLRTIFEKAGGAVSAQAIVAWLQAQGWL